MHLAGWKDKHEFLFVFFFPFLVHVTQHPTGSQDRSSPKVELVFNLLCATWTWHIVTHMDPASSFPPPSLPSVLPSFPFFFLLSFFLRHTAWWGILQDWITVLEGKVWAELFFLSMQTSTASVKIIWAKQPNRPVFYLLSEGPGRSGLVATVHNQALSALS